MPPRAAPRPACRTARLVFLLLLVLMPLTSLQAAAKPHLPLTSLTMSDKNIILSLLPPSQQAYFTGSGLEAAFGSSVAVAGDTVAISAPAG